MQLKKKKLILGLSMNELKIKLNPKAIKRFKEFIESDVYNEKNDLAKHWSKRIDSNIDAFRIVNNEVCVSLIDSGLTDHYPQHFGFSNYKRGLFKSLAKSLLNKIGIHSSPVYNPKYFFLNFWPEGKSIISLNNIYDEYGKVDDYSIFKGCYFFNEISEICKLENISYKSILEIGPGSGNLQRLIKKYNPDSRSILIDLPSSIPYSFLHLMNRFPESKFLLPNEINSSDNLSDYDFSFLTNNQTDFIPKDSIDLAINTMSFQEMRKVDVEKYFMLLRSVLKNENLFYCVNAVEKVMTFDGVNTPIRFSEFPWLENDYDYKYELSSIEIGRTYKPFFVKALRMGKNI